MSKSKLHKCTVCNKKKQLQEFYLRPSGTVSEYKCKACLRAKRKLHSEDNYEQVRAGNRKAVTKHQKLYPDRNTANVAKYHAAKQQAVPSWVDNTELSRIKSVYKQARNISKRTGIRHEVDHIVPLRGKIVCGLHTIYNLQVIPKLDNLRKANLLVEDIVCTTEKSIELA